MSALSNFLEAALINAVFRNVPYNSPPEVYIALFKTDPTDDAIGQEETGAGYSRQQIVFSVPSDGLTENIATVTFPVAGSDWGTVSHFGIMDAITGGNLLIHGRFNIIKTIYSGDQYIIRAGDLDISFN